MSMTRLRDNLHKLEYFIKVVEAGSIREGSSMAHLSQPQMSKVIRQLEDSVGEILFQRSKNGVKLTRGGDILYQHAIQILRASDKAEALIKSSEHFIKGTVSIGTYDSIARYFFPEVLKFFKISQPELTIKLNTGRSSDMVKKLKAGELDFAIVVNASGYPKVARQSLYVDHFGLYTSPKIKSDFVNQLIFFDFKMNDVKNTASKFGFSALLTCDNLETVKALTEEELGVGLLPHKVARDGVMKGSLVPFSHPRIKNNKFDSHSIDICFGKYGESERMNYLKQELTRFFELWLKS
jgi:DNA-binding transcriptional LysR family regulator